MKGIELWGSRAVGAFGCALCAFVLFACTAEQEIRCGEGTELVGGRCVPIAGDGGLGEMDGGQLATCGDGTQAVDGRCEALRPVGAPCEEGAQCESGACLGADRGAQDGYCTILNCSNNRPCPNGSRCYYSSTEDTYLCLSYCDGDGSCREGYACQPLYTVETSVCAPSCEATGACPAGTLCDAESGRCELHECELGASDACAIPADAGVAMSDAGTSATLVCYADRLGISESGAVCLPSCDPSEPDTCTMNEVCQPLPEDPENTGLCVPPLCATTEDCSAGASCMNGVCQPPARCLTDGSCAGTGSVCVGGPGGQCMPRCPDEEGESCEDLHSGLRCSTSLDACLPAGSFPGSECASDLNAACSPLAVTNDDDEVVMQPMVCERGKCIVTCGSGGSELCEDVSSTLTCAEDVFDEPLCLPKGSFPGGPCGAGDSCDAVTVGELSLPMVCESDRDLCLVGCNADEGGDVLCAGVDASLVCIEDAFESGSDMCLPRGSYPGAPCGPGNACDDGMTCEDDLCLYECGEGGEALCDGISDTLSCATGVYDEPVCLPRGSFPGSPCRDGGTPPEQCDQALGGLPGADMICNAGTCVVQCETPGTVFASGEAICRTVSAGLTCLGSVPFSICVAACDDGMTSSCADGYSCLGGENACLPDGSFLGSDCAGGTECDPESALPLVCVPGAEKCGAACGPLGAGADGYCEALNGMFGTTFDACVDLDPRPDPDNLLVCQDTTP